MSLTSNADAINVGILLRELYVIPVRGPWDERPDREKVADAARALAEAAYKKLGAGVRPDQIEGVNIRTLTEEEWAELNEIYDRMED